MSALTSNARWLALLVAVPLLLACGAAESFPDPTPTNAPPAATATVSPTAAASPTPRAATATPRPRALATPTVPATSTASAERTSTATPQLTATPAAAPATATTAPPTATPEPPTPTPDPCPGAVPWDQAMQWLGQQVTVRGPVMSTAWASESRGQPTFLNLGLPYPDPGRFTVVIWIGNRDNFPQPPEQAYAGTTLCVSGVVDEYQGSAEMEVVGPEQIVVVP